jgi:hypothetical protein
MEIICSSETSVDFQWTAWRYITQDTNIQSTLNINEHKIMSDHDLALLATCFYADSLLGLFFDPEDGDDMCFRNGG